MPVEALARATELGRISFAYYDRLHQDPGPPSDQTYAELLARLGQRAATMPRLFAALGLAEPQPPDRLSRHDEAMLLSILDVVAGNRAEDLVLRSLLILGDFARRGTEATIQVYGEALDREPGDVAGMPLDLMYEQFLQPWARFARFIPELTGWLNERHLSTMIDSWSVDETERLLGLSGFVPVREVDPPAVSFIDLTGITRLAEEQGDLRAAELATEFATLSASVAARREGRLVKQLGDGVLLRFPDARAGVESTLEILAALRDGGLPSGHAGIDAGPLIVRDGDVFGRTVNRAARIADIAPAGQLLATETLATALAEGVARHEPAGVATLQGIAEPVQLVRLLRP